MTLAYQREKLKYDGSRNGDKCANIYYLYIVSGTLWCWTAEVIFPENASCKISMVKKFLYLAIF
jgi:hypothetical protein